MAKGKLSEDTINFIVTAESSQLQQEIHKTSKTIDDLKRKETELRKEQAAYKAVLGESSKEYKEATRKLKENTQAIANESLKLEEMHKKLGTNTMTMAQLRKEAKMLQRQLDNTSKALNPKAYAEYEAKLKEVNGRMAELKGTADSLKDVFNLKGGFWKSFLSSGFNMSSLKTMLMSSGILAGFAFIFETAVKIGREIFEKAKIFYEFNVEIEEARRLTREFLNVEGKQLTELNSQISAIAKQTGKEYKEVLNAVDTLVKQFGIDGQEAVEKIKDGIQAGADENGTFLQQIRQYAPAFRDAGVSVGELIALITQTRSGIFNEEGMRLIQTATNRIRTMGTATQKAIDGIGISSQQLERDLTEGKTSLVGAIQQISARIGELPQQSQQVGEVMKTVFGKTASNEGMKMVTMLADINTNMDELKGITGEYGQLQRDQIDAQAELNKQLTETFGIGEGGFKEMTAKAEIFILKGLVKMIKYCRSLYDELKTVRVVIEGIKIAFDTVFKVCELGFDWLIDIIKGVARLFRDLAAIIEGVFTGDVSQVESAWKRLGDGLARTGREIADDGKDVGTRWGNNVVDSINKVLKKNKVKPEVELPEVTVTGHRRDPKNPKPPAGGGSADVKTKDSDNLSISSFSSQRQQDLEEAMRYYQQDVNALRTALADKRLSQELYNSMMAQLTVEHTKNLQQIEQSYYERSQQLEISDGSRKQQLVDQQLKNVEKASQQSFDARLKQQEQFNAMLENLSGMGPAPELTEEDKYQQKLSALSSYYQACLEYARKNGQDEAEITKAYEKVKADYKKQYELQESERRAKVREQLGIEQQSEYERQHEMLVEALENEYITKQEYAEKEKLLKMESWKEQFDYYHQLFGDTFQAIQDAEMANIDAKYDAEIEAARKAGKDVTAIENKKANEKLKIEKKYADVDFAIKAAQIVADTVVGITKVWASPGYPMAIPLTVLLAALGAANLVAANAQRQKVKSMTLNGGGSSTGSGARVSTGREEGGYVDVEREQDGRRFHAKYDPKKRGYVNQPTVIVGEGPRPKEWIASNDAVENPTVAPLINVLDQMQRAGTIRTFDLNKYMMQQQTKGLARGGSISTTPPGTVPGTNLQPTDTGQTSRLADILERIDRDGLPVYLGLDEFDAKQRIRERLNNIAKIG